MSEDADVLREEFEDAVGHWIDAYDAWLAPVQVTLDAAMTNHNQAVHGYDHIRTLSKAREYA